MLVGMVVLAGRLERMWRPRLRKAPSGAGGKIPSSEEPEASSSGPATMGSTDDGWIMHDFSKEAGTRVERKVLTRGGDCGFGTGFTFTCCAELVMNAGWFVLI